MDSFSSVLVVLVIFTAHLQVIVAINFDICGLEEILDANGSISFNSSSVKAAEKSFQCRRVIRVPNGRVKFVLNKLTVGGTFEIYDGAYTNHKIALDSKGQPTIYKTSGNSMLIIFKGTKPNKGDTPSILQANFTAIPFQSSCSCPSLKNGIMRCDETITERKCDFQCMRGFVDLADSVGAYACNLINGKWNKSIHSNILSCQEARIPSAVTFNISFRYNSNNCSLFDTTIIMQKVGDFLKAKSDVVSKGECFKEASKSSCNLTALNATCETNGNQSVITVFIQDQITAPTSESFRGLNATYMGISFKELEPNLTITSGNESFSINTLAKSQVAGVCLDGTFFISHPGSLASPVCSKCPLGHFYERGSYKCKMCAAGYQAPEGSTSCTSKGVPLVPLVSSCVNKCMKGKGLDKNTGYCQWCRHNTFQNSTEVLNPTCDPCPDGKKTPFTGAYSSDQCYAPCPMGSYLNTTSAQCGLCPLGTYLDMSDHVITTCRLCGGNTVTIKMGSKTLADCQACAVGNFFNSTTNNCSTCPGGSYQDNVNQKSCMKCPDGKSTLDSGSASSSDCIPTCNKGSYIDKASNNTCEKCPIGAYQAMDKYLETTCKKCGAHKSTSQTGADSETLCVYNCSAGQYFVVSESKCKTCPIGSYQNVSGQGSCIKCPPGTSTLGDNQRSKQACVVLCGQGEYLKEDIKKCSLCPMGTYQSAGNHNKDTCQSCLSKMSITEGATNQSSCTKVCDTFPCMNGASCSETSDNFTCHCHQGLSGQLCDVIESEDELERVGISVRFTDLEWNDKLMNTSTAEYKKTRNTIERSVRKEFKEDNSLRAVQVTKLTQGSVIASIDLYLSDNSSLVPAKILQIAVANGSVGGLPVDRESFRVKQSTCGRALGMASGRIKDEQITATSNVSDHEPNQGRLHNGQGWHAKGLESDEYLQIRFLRTVNITAVATQGVSSGLYVTAYTISVSTDAVTWSPYTGHDASKIKKFNANNDTDTVIKNDILPPITSVRYIRVQPVSWNSRIGMRIEVYGCISDPVLRPDEIPTPPFASTAVTKETDTAGPEVDAKKDEYSWGKYLGIVFGLLMVIGVLLAAVFWWRSSKKKAERDKSPLVMSKFQDSNYRIIEKNADEFDEEDVV